MIELKKIDLRKERYLLFVDTETIGSLFVQDSVLPFEIGTKVYDMEKGQVIRQKSYLVRKFLNNKYIMFNTFSATKYPTYLERIKTDKCYKSESVKDIMQDLLKVINRYNIKIMVAHNGNFDKCAIARLCEEFGTDNPTKNIDLLDTMELSKIITFSKEYSNYCIENMEIKNSLNESAFITNSGRVRTTAQAIYSFITKNPQFQEAHTGLEDIDIEIEIFKKSMEMLGNPMVALNVAPTWKDYAKVIEED